MYTKTEISLHNFFIFNPLYGAKEGEELKKILFYHPVKDNADTQMKNVGLVEGILNFARVFEVSSSDICTLHTEKTRQIYFEAETNFWISMTLNLPVATKLKDGKSVSEYMDEDIQDNVYEAVLKQAYYMYRLFWNTFESTIKNENTGALKAKLENFYSAYLKNLKLAHCDILNIFSGIQYLPLDKQTFLKVQCLINSLECNHSNIVHTAFLYNDHLIWSGVEPSDMQIIYQYLIGTLLPANMEVELQGGSMPRNSLSPFAPLRHGRFILGPSNLKNAKTIGKIPKLYTFSGETSGCYHLVVYRALSASVFFFIKGDDELSLDFFKEIDTYLSPKLTTLVSDVADYCSKQVITPSSIPESTPRFIYFNNLNLAYKSTVHLDNKQTGNIAISNEQLKIIADLRRKASGEDHGETIVKTLQDFWVVSKRSNFREFYVVEQQKNAHLIDISKDIRLLCESELKGIFFNPL